MNHSKITVEKTPKTIGSDWRPSRTKSLQVIAIRVAKLRGDKPGERELKVSQSSTDNSAPNNEPFENYSGRFPRFTDFDLF